MQILWYCQGEILRGFKLSPKSYLERFRTMKRSGNDSNVQFLSKLKDIHRYYLDSKSITTFESLSEDIIAEQLRSVLSAETVTFVDQRRVEDADEIAKLADLFFETIRDKKRANNGRNPQGSVRVVQSKFMEPNRDLSSAQTKFNKNTNFCNNFDRNQKPGMQSRSQA